MRGLAGSSWQKDRQQFREYAVAVVGSAEFALAQATQKAVAARRDLASSRLLLQSILKSVSNLFRLPLACASQSEVSSSPGRNLLHVQAHEEFREEEVFGRVASTLEAVQSQEERV